MSAFIHEHSHILAIVNSVRYYALDPVTIDGICCDVLDDEYADLVCKILMAENIRSVNARYDEEHPLFDGIVFKAYKPFSLMGLHMAISSLDYQSCETEDWRETFACQLLDNWTTQIETRVKHTPDSIRECREYNEQHTWHAQ